jgi:multiple sugar transport system permease protein
MKSSTQITRYAKSAIIGIALAVLLVWTVFPLYWVIITAFKDQTAVFQSPPLWWPNTNGVLAFGQLMATGVIYNFESSFIVSISSTLAVVFIGALTGYAIARFKAGGNFLPFWVLSQRMLPPIAFLVPIFLMFSTLDLVNTYQGLAYAYAAFNLPYAVWMMRTFFEDLPAEIEEAAEVDGCGRLGAFARIAVPLAAPGIVATVIFTYILAWNEFLFALVLMRSVNMFTVPVTEYIFYYGATSGARYNEASLQALLAILPVLALSIYIQKYLVRGLTFGAVKG